MEKRKPHYNLSDIKAVVLQHGMDAFTLTARNNARLMELSEREALSVVLGLQRSMLTKSMTTVASSQVWQDVYHAPCPNGKLAYVKVTLRADVVVIQFKEK